MNSSKSTIKNVGRPYLSDEAFKNFVATYKKMVKQNEEKRKEKE
ncbi:hypothetical protein [Alkalihalobacterium alkalinitrilicum]|nr:hypothetical protein [Alkalihalobacterium alkalinitrilicum]